MATYTGTTIQSVGSLPVTVESYGVNAIQLVYSTLASVYRIDYVDIRGSSLNQISQAYQYEVRDSDGEAVEVVDVISPDPYQYQDSIKNHPTRGLEINGRGTLKFNLEANGFVRFTFYYKDVELSDFLELSVQDVMELSEPEEIDEQGVVFMTKEVDTTNLIEKIINRKTIRK